MRPLLEALHRRYSIRITCATHEGALPWTHKFSTLASTSAAGRSACRTRSTVRRTSVPPVSWPRPMRLSGNSTLSGPTSAFPKPNWHGASTATRLASDDCSPQDGYGRNSRSSLRLPTLSARRCGSFPEQRGRNLERVTAAASGVSLPLPRHGRLRSDPCPLAISILDELDAHLRERWNTGSSAAADTREGRATSGGTSRASAEPLPSPRCSNRRCTDAPSPMRHPDRRVSLVRGTVPRRSGQASAERHPVKLCDAKLDFAMQSKLALQCKVWCSSGAPRRPRCTTTLALTRK